MYQLNSILFEGVVECVTDRVTKCQAGQREYSIWFRIVHTRHGCEPEIWSVEYPKHGDFEQSLTKGRGVRIVGKIAQRSGEGGRPEPYICAEHIELKKQEARDAGN